MVVRSGGGRRRFLCRGARGDGEKLKTDGYGKCSGEQRTPCGERQGRQGFFIMLGWRQGTTEWADNPVRGQTGQPEMAREEGQE